MALRQLEGIDAPPIFIGGLSAARDEAALRAAAITHVVDLTASGIDYEGFRHRGVRYLRIDLQDQPRADLAVHLPRINEFVNMARKKHGAPVLLHCSSGNSRSPAAACAYLVEHCAMTLQRALEVCGRVTKTCINVGFLSQLADFEVATMLYRIEQQMPRPSELILKKAREQVRTTIDLTELAVDQLVMQYEDGFLCRGMPQEVFTRKLCRAALEERPVTEAGLVDAMMCLEQQNRRSSNIVREADLAAYEKLRAETAEKQKRREQRELEAIREIAGDGPESAADVDLLAEDEEEKNVAIAKLRDLKTREDVGPQIEVDVAEMSATAEEIEQMTATQLFNRKQEENEVARMKEEARRLEEEAAAQAAARRQGEEQNDAGAAVSDGADTESGVDADGSVAEEETVAATTPEPDDAVDSDVVALAMRRKVDKERENAAQKIQQLVRR